MLTSSVSAQINKSDAEAFFIEADKSTVDYILIFAELKFDEESQDYIMQRTAYKAIETTIEFKETCLVLKSEENLIYIPYMTIRDLYKGKDKWVELEKPYIKIDLIGNRNVSYE